MYSMTSATARPSDADAKTVTADELYQFILANAEEIDGRLTE